MISGIDDSFRRFAKRFVRHYWEEVASSDDVPTWESLPESGRVQPLHEIVYETSCHHTTGPASGNICSLRMMNTAGNVWRFTFSRKNRRWHLITATSGSADNDAHVNLLDDQYEHWFRPFLERIVFKALRSD